MKNKYFSAAAIALSVFYFTTCGNDTGGAETWTWTERAFSLEITGSGETIQVGDRFTLHYMGIGTLTGTVREVNAAENSRANGGISDPWDNGMGPPIIVKPDPPDDGKDNEFPIYTPPVPPGPPAPPPSVYIDTELRFPGYDKPVKGVVNRDGLIVKITLPESVGEDEIGGKSYSYGNNAVWTFNKNERTYKYTRIHPYSPGNPDDTTIETGNYTWNSNTKTVMLLPQQVVLDDSTVLNINNAASFYINYFSSEGWDDAYVSEITGGKYTTLNEYIIALVNQDSSMQVYTYEAAGGALVLDQFTRNLVTVLDITAATIGGCEYTSPPSFSASGGHTDYELSITYEEAKAKLVALLGAPDIEASRSDPAWQNDDIVTIQDQALDCCYRLIWNIGDSTHICEWYRLNINGGASRHR